MQQFQQETDPTGHANGAEAAQTGAVETMEAAAAAPVAVDVTLQTLAVRARSRDAGERHAALRALQQRGVEGLPTLLELFRGEMRGQQRRKRFRLLAFIGGTTGYLVNTGMSWFIGMELWIVPLICVITIFFCAIVFIYLWRMILNPRQQEIAETLARIDDTRAINTLIEAMTYEGAQVPAVRDTLIKLLRRVRPTDAGLIDRARRPALYGILDNIVNDGAQVALDLAILAAIEQMGDAEALPYVRRLTQRSAWTPGQRTVFLRAEECLRDWETTQAHARGGTTLLRAAHSPVDSPDILLRSVDAEAMPVSEQLLRSSDSGDATAIQVNHRDAAPVEPARIEQNTLKTGAAETGVIELTLGRESEHDHAE